MPVAIATGFCRRIPRMRAAGPVAYKTICEEDVPAPTLDEIRKATRQERNGCLAQEPKVALAQKNRVRPIF